MEIIKNVTKSNMENAMIAEAKLQYSACSDDCPRCRISDG